MGSRRRMPAGTPRKSTSRKLLTAANGTADTRTTIAWTQLARGGYRSSIHEPATSGARMTASRCTFSDRRFFIANSHNDINENSIAFTLRYRSFCMLFTGDAGATAEQRFLAEGADLRCDVLKVGTSRLGLLVDAGL